MLDNLFLIIGISGVFVIALDFLLEVFNKLSRNHKIFTVLNLYGSFALFLYALYFKVWLFVVLNGFLLLVGLFGLFRAYRKSLKKIKF